MAIFGNIVLLVISFVLLAKGADFFVDGASGIATKLRIPQIIIGLTIVAMGTSAPEAAVSISAALDGNAAITIGNIVGSNILNILIILGISSVIARLAVSKDTNFVDIPVMLGATVLLFALGWDGSIGLIDGIIFLVVLVLYLAYLFIIARQKINKRELAALTAQATALPAEECAVKDSTAAECNTRPAAADDKDEPDEDKPRPLWLAVIFTALGLAMIILGSNFAVDSATFLAKAMGVSDRFIGLTVIALGTSLPELFTSVTAAIKKNADIAIGNIVGSNIFNILFIVGLSAVITPVPFEKSFLIDTAISFAAGIILWVPCLTRNGIWRITGIIMLLGYAGYFTYLTFMG